MIASHTHSRAGEPGEFSGMRVFVALAPAVHGSQF